MSTSTEKLSSPCHNRWFDTVSTNLGTSLGFDHNDEKNVRFLTLATFILWKIICWRAMSLSLARLDSGRRKLLRWTPWNSCQMFLKLCLPFICTQKKKRHIPNVILKYFINWSIYELFYNCPRKNKIETTGVSVKRILIFSTRSL